MERLRGCAIELLIGLLFLHSAVWAQSTAQISGTVKDPTGAVVPNAEISAIQTNTGLKRTVTGDANGSYTLTNLPLGPYRLEAASPSFRTYVQTGIVLQVDASPVINPILEVGQVSEQVQVDANAMLVETQSSGVGTVIDNQRVLELPLNGRNPIELVILSGQATVATGNAASLKNISGYSTIGLSVAGGVSNQVLYLLDGAHHVDTHTGLGFPLPFPDALQEFKVETSALPAQYGYHSAAVVSAVTRAGTNELHGDLFEFVRNGVFNARDFFAATRDTLKRNQFGGVVGGPILKNKLFFFAGYQGTLQRSDPTSSIAYVPTPAMLAGDFTAVASPGCNGGRQINLAAAQGFANNQISPLRFDPVALKLTSLFPVPAGPCGQVRYGLRSDQNDSQGVARIDYSKSERHSLFGRLLIDNLLMPSSFDGTDPLTVSIMQINDRFYSLVLGDTFLISSNVISTFRVAANREEFTDLLDQCGCSWPELGARNVYSSEHAPLLTVSGSGGSGFVIGGGSSAKFATFVGPNPNLGEDLGVIKGSHQLGFGVNYLYTLQNFLWGNKAAGSMTVNGQASGMPLADFLLGNASAWNQGEDNRYYYRQHHLGLYAQDSWKITARLRLNYGVRWEPYLTFYSKNGQFSHFDANNFAQNIHSAIYVNAPAGLIFPGDAQYTAGNHAERNRWNEFFPRIGLVWDPTGDGRMTVRAAYGMLVDQQHQGSAHVSFSNNPPFGNAISLANVKMSDPWATYAAGNPFPFTLSKDIVFPTFGQYRFDPLDQKPPYVNEWNLSVQRQVGKDWLLSATYSGSSTIHLSSSSALNPALFLGLGSCSLNGVNYPVCSTTANTNQRRLLYLQNPGQGQYYAQMSVAADGTGSYNGLLLSTQKRLSRGVSILANYTWSHCISDIWDVLTAPSLNLPGQRRYNRSNCLTGDQRQIFNLSAVLQTPRFTSAVLRRIGSDWQLSPIMKIRSAQFVTVTTGVDNELDGQASELPNLVSGVSPYASDQTVNHWLNPAAFAVPAPGTIGGLGRNDIKGPGVFQLDMALSRIFTIREKKTLQLRGEAFNILNHPSFGTPVATLNSGSFGQILSDISGNSGLSAGNPRILQFALKLVF